MGMTKLSYAEYRFPPEITRQAIWLYLRFTLSLRDIEDLLAKREIEVSCKTAAVGRTISVRSSRRIYESAALKPHPEWHLAK